MKGKVFSGIQARARRDKSLEPCTTSTFQGKFAIQFYILNDAII